MAGSPFGPWAKRRGPLDPSAKTVARSTLVGIRGEIAELYRAFFPAILPLDLDRHELWQIAVLLGLDEEPELLQGPTVAVVAPQAEPGDPLQSGPRLRRVALGGV